MNEVYKAECDNHVSTHKYAAKVERELIHQISLGYYVKASTAPQVISPLGAILKDDGDITIIHDACRPMGMAMNIRHFKMLVN